MAVTTDYLAGLSDTDREKLESWLFEFDQGWTPKRLSESLDELPSENNEFRMAALTEMVKVDMERQWKAGRKRYLEEYLSEFFELGTAETVSPDLIQTEYVVRKSLGEQIRIEDYSKRFPRQINEVKKLLKEIQRKGSAAGHARQTSDTIRPTDTTDSLAEQREFDESVPRQIGRYRIIRKLGEGAMGAVYLALDEQLARQVALKTPTFSGDSAPELIERFYREARAAATIRHPNICTVFDVGEIDGTHYITMAYIEGRPMSDYITRDQRFPQRGAALIFRKIATALQEAHQLGVVHRDLKPANIMIDQNREPVVMDFGLAQRTKELGEARLTHSGMILGTPAYMSPEQITGDLERIGPCCDIYSLGVILYELLTGELPFEGSIAAVIGQILTQQPKKPSELRPNIDPKLEAICLKMMEKKIEVRYSSMQKVADDLRDFLKSSSSPPSQAESPEKTSPEKTSSAPPSDEEALAALFAYQEAEQEARRKQRVKFPSSRKRKQTKQKPLKQKQSKRERPETLVIQLERPKASVKKPAARSNPLPKLLGRLKQIPPGTRWIAAASAAVVVLLLGIVLFVRTEEGTLRIEINDPNISVSVNGKEITITDGEASVPLEPGKKTLSVKVGGTTIDLGKTIRLTADGRKIAIKLGNAELTGETFTIVKGTDVVLKVTLEPVPPPDPHRRAAERILSLGGQIGISNNRGWIRDASKLPDTPFTINSIRLRKKRQVTDDDLKLLTGLTSITKLNLMQTNITDAGLKHLSGLTGLKILYLLQTKVSAAGVDKLREALPDCRILSDDDPEPDNDYDRLLRGKWVSVMDELRRRAAKVSNVRVTSDGGLDMTRAEFVIDWMRARNAIIRVRIKKTDSGKHPELRLRFVKSSSSEPSGAAQWYAAYLDHWNRFGMGRKHRKKWKDLEVKHLSRRYDDYFEWTLAVIENEVSVYVDGKQILSASDNSLRDGYPSIHSGPSAIFNDVEVMVLDQQADPQRRAAERILDLDGLVSISKRRGWIRNASELPEKPFTINRIDLRKKRQITDDDLKLLTGLTSITKLNLMQTNITDAGLKHLSGLTGLKILYLRQTKVSDAGLKHLSGLTGLKILYLRQTKVSDAGVDKLREALPGCRITIKGRRRDKEKVGPAAPTSVNDYDRLLRGKWVSVMDELRRRAAKEPNVRVTSDGGLDMTRAEFIIDWMRARNAIIRVRIKKTDSGKHPELRLRFVKSSSSEPSGAAQWYAAYLDHWDRFGMGRKHRKKWKDLEVKHLGRQYDDYFEWTLAVIENEVSVYVDGKQILSASDNSLRDGYPSIHSGPSAIFNDVEVMVLDQQADPHRRAAERILSLGGQIISSNNRGWITNASELPDTPFTINRISLKKKRQVTDDDLKLLAGLTSITSLDLMQTNITDDGLKHLSGLTELQELYLNSTKITGAGLKHLKGLSKLGTLAIIVQSFNDDDLRHLVGLEGLKSLHLPAVGNVGVDHLSKMKQLVRLTFNGSIVPAEGIDRLQELPQLQTLAFDGKLVTDEHVRHLADLKQLQTLRLFTTSVTEAALAHLKDLPSLSNLYLDATPVGDAGLKHFKLMPALRTLSLSRTKVTDAGLAELAKLTKLEKLSLYQTNIGDAGLEHLKSMTALKSLQLRKTKVSAAGVDKLRDALPDCRIFSDDNPSGKKNGKKRGRVQTNTEADPAEPAAGDQNVTTDPQRRAAERILELGGHIVIGQELLRKVSQLPEGPFTIKTIWLRINSRVTDDDLKLLGGLTSITSLDLRHTDISDDGLKHLSGLTELQTLLLNRTKITGAGLKHLKGLSKLSTLAILNQGFKDDDLQHLVGLEKLIILYLPTVGNVGVDHLSKMKLLERLYFDGSIVPAEGIDRLQELPQLQTLALDGKLVTDEHVRHLAGLKQLQSLTLSNASVTEAALTHLKELPNLSDLNLFGTPVGDVWLKHFNEMPALIQLSLRGTKVTDAGLAELAKLTKLETLSLFQTNIGDAGIEHFKSLTALKSLELRQTKVTAAGVDKLRDALPDCIILSDDDP